MKAPVFDCLLPFADTSAWVAWNPERRNGEVRKVPKCPCTGANASVSDPRTWDTLASTCSLAEVRAYPGVGIVSAAVPALVFLDLDRCIDFATGDPTNDDAMRLLDACADTYAERAPSGAGVRIIGTAAAIEANISRKGATQGGLALEVYKAAPRYLTVTGRRYGEHPDALADIGDVVLDLLPLLGKATPTEGGGDGRDQQPFDPHGLAPVYKANECLLQEGQGPRSRAFDLFHALQLRPHPSDASLHARNGRWPHGSPLGTGRYGSRA